MNKIVGLARIRPFLCLLALAFVVACRSDDTDSDIVAEPSDNVGAGGGTDNGGENNEPPNVDPTDPDPMNPSPAPNPTNPDPTKPSPEPNPTKPSPVPAKPISELTGPEKTQLCEDLVDAGNQAIESVDRLIEGLCAITVGGDAPNVAICNNLVSFCVVLAKNETGGLPSEPLNPQVECDDAASSDVSDCDDVTVDDFDACVISLEKAFNRVIEEGSCANLVGNPTTLTELRQLVSNFENGSGETPECTVVRERCPSIF